MNKELFMTCSVVLFGILGSATLCIQIHKIWSGKSAQSVSGAAAIVIMSFFAAYAIYGMRTGTRPAVIQGVWRSLFWAPVAIGIARYGKVGIRHLSLGLVCLIMLIMMNFPSLRSPIVYTFTVMMIYFIWVQAYVIVSNKARGKVSLSNQIVPHLSAVTWVIYGMATDDKTLAITSLMNAVSYIAVMAAWVKYPNPSSKPKLQPAIAA
jgi:uncharacterized protein with PQ loop repeat